MNLFKVLLIVLDTLSLFIGVIGIVVAGLPTTPCILLTAGLYIKSSDKLCQKLTSNRFVGYYIIEFQTKKKMTKKTKLYAISTMWIMITLSCLFFITPLTFKLVVSLIGLIGTLVMGYIVPTVNISNNNNH
jgi:uncharacterized protein